MRLLLTVAILTVLFCVHLSGVEDAAAAPALYLQQRCESDGTVSLGFGWEGNDPQARQQWLDLSSTDTWQPGSFRSAGPLGANVTTFVWAGWQPGARAYARINQQLANGTWDASITYRVEVQTCGGAPQLPATPLPPAPLPAQLPPSPAASATVQTPQAQPRIASGAGLITSFTTSINRGNYVFLNAQTLPSASCSLSYNEPSGVPSTATGLGSKDADQTGSVFWSWQIAGTSNPGIGTVNVTCAGQSQMAPLLITS